MKKKLPVRARKMEMGRGATDAGKQPTPEKGSPIASRRVGPAFGFVNLLLKEVECVKTTKEVDRDEIVLATIVLEAEAKATDGRARVEAKARKGDVVAAGKFKNGDRERFKPAKLLTKFPAGGADADWPRYYVAMLLMIEKDEGAVGTIVNAALESVEKELTAAISTTVAAGATSVLSGLASGAAIGSAIPVPLVGTAVGAAVGTAVGLAIGQIKKSRSDDVFEPKDVQLRLQQFPAQVGELAGSERSVVFKGFKGTYKVTYAWTVA